MQKPREMTALQWLAPSMARDGLIKNSAWAMPAAAEAASLFGDPDLHLPAQFLAVLDRYAVDYIKQAPALVVAATSGKRLVRRADRLEVAKRFIAACESRLRLPALMQSYGLAPQLRALSGSVLRHHHRDLLEQLSDIPPSTLAQSIPKAADEQHQWLQGLEYWRSHMARHFHDRNLFLDWAAVNVRGGEARRFATDIADFAGRNRATFDRRWNFAQARAASERWHAELARRPFGAAARSADWTELIDYAPLPSHFEIDGFTFHALQTREALYEEGARMHHCVRLYSDRVARGSSRIYSVRQDGRRIATLELVRTARVRSAAPRYVLSQLKGPRNSSPPMAAAAAAAAFVAHVDPDAGRLEGAPLQAAAAIVPQRPIDRVRLVGFGHGLRGLASSERGARARAELRHLLGDEVYASWFRAMEFGAFDGSVLSVTFPVRFLANWVRAHYLDILLRCCAGEFAGVERIDVGLRGQSTCAVPSATPSYGLEGSPLEPRFTFDNFAVGPSNQIAHAAACRVAQTVRMGPAADFNPLIIHAGIGLGKTHLLHAIAWQALRGTPAARVLYLTAERLRYGLVEASRNAGLHALRERLRSIDLLLIDDLEFLRGSEIARELEDAVHARLDGGRRVVLASAVPPASLDWLGERLRLRLQRGFVAEIGPLDTWLRFDILGKQIGEKRQRDPSFDIGPEVASWIAVQNIDSGRVLEGLVTRLQAAWSYLRRPITVPVAETVLRDLVLGPEPRRIKIEDILEVVSRHFGVSRAEVLSQRRHRSVVWPRQVAMYLARQLTRRSLPEIGRRLGGRDSVGVLHAIRQIEALLPRNPQLGEEIEALARLLHGGVVQAGR
jgi:chromosomal replication initiator protein